jgi:8-oxo-dGTP pyrophosphatase MutT (NUDIX family)
VRRKPVVIAKPGDNEDAAEEQDARGSIFVHQRAAEKRIFSSLFDMFVGGVSTAGEPAEVTVLRELKEELSIDAQHSSGSDSGSSSSSSCHRLDFLFDCAVSTELNNRCRSSVFDLPDCSPAAAASIRFQASEVQGGAWEARTAVDLAA